MQLRQFPDKNRFFDLAKSANVHLSAPKSWRTPSHR